MRAVPPERRLEGIAMSASKNSVWIVKKDNHPLIMKNRKTYLALVAFALLTSASSVMAQTGTGAGQTGAAEISSAMAQYESMVNTWGPLAIGVSVLVAIFTFAKRLIAKH